jgi:hypothetical protein
MIDHPDAQHLLELERAALERWCKGDPSGFLELSAPDVVYFDPFLERRLDGLEALERYYEGLRGQVSATAFEIMSPRVTIDADMAVLTFNFVSRGSDGAEHRWNCTEVYLRRSSRWQIIQTHWSLTKPPTSPN